MNKEKIIGMSITNKINKVLNSEDYAQTLARRTGLKNQTVSDLKKHRKTCEQVRGRALSSLEEVFNDYYLSGKIDTSKKDVIGLPIYEKIKWVVNSEPIASNIAREVGVSGQKINDIKRGRTLLKNLSGRVALKLEKAFNRFLMEGKINFTKEKMFTYDRTLMTSDIPDFIILTLKRATSIDDGRLIFKLNDEEFNKKYVNLIKKEVLNLNHTFIIKHIKDFNDPIYRHVEEFHITLNTNFNHLDKTKISIKLVETKLPKVALQ